MSNCGTIALTERMKINVKQYYNINMYLEVSIIDYWKLLSIIEILSITD